MARLRLALQIARFREDELTEEQLLSAEIERVIARIRNDQDPYKSWLSIQADKSLMAGRWEVRSVPAVIADVLHRCFHYIGTPRGGISLGLYDEEAGASSPPGTLLTFSVFDLDIKNPLPCEIGPTNILVLSRVYSFRWAPRNAFSYTFRRALRWLRTAHPHVQLLLTYVNPNVGFSGSSYLASNWLPFVEESIRYDYLDGEYITRRELDRLLREKGLDESQLRRMCRLEQSHLTLQPLQILAFPVTQALRERLKAMVAVAA